MISKECIALYRSIQAPASLKETIEKKQETVISVSTANKRHTGRRILPLAACLALVILAGIPFLKNPPGRGGNETAVRITEQNGFIRSYAAEAQAQPLVLSLDMPAASAKTATVSHGEIMISNDQSPAVVQWVIHDPSPEQQATLTLIIEDNLVQYLLHLDAEGIWYLELEK